MPAEPRITAMSEADAADVLRIYAEGIATGDATFQTDVPSWPQWDAAHLAHPRLVARENDGRVVGWCALSPVSSREVYRGVVEESVYVSADARGRRVGHALLSAMVQAADDAGIWTIQTGIFPENTASLRLHEACGFRVLGLRERIGKSAAGVWRDVVFLERRSRVAGQD